MKKIIAMLLAVVMVCALSVSAFAAPTTEDALTNPVTGTYSQQDHADVAYVINIQWGAMTCTFTVGTQVWDTNTHTWIDPGEGVWSYNGNTITITNDSSVAITAYATYAPADGYNAISGSFKDGEGNDVTNAAPASLAKPVGGNETTATLTLALTGALAGNETTKAGTTIGNITITLGDVA